jgi:adenine deaminase
VVAGTDAPIDLNVVALHMNMRAMVKYGMAPYEALLTATRFAGESIDVPLGQVAPGMLADLAMVEGDPLTRIEDAAKVKMVMKNGVAYTPEELMEPFARLKAAEVHDHGVQLAALPPHPENARFWWHEAEYVETGRQACCADIVGFGAFAAAKKARRLFRAEAV